MRTLLKVTMDMAAGNAAIADGSLQTIIEETIDRLKPECTYFYPEHGNRACFMVFDLKDPSDIPSITEPLFTRLQAQVEFCPVMNRDDLQKGLKAAYSARRQPAMG
ncbi:DUF3303 family protein [Flaviaesturariibacter aridisoli]|uniref:Uncharacterized protein n=1 Tax=Flaviaesturariibacter aridisoli TaxID=2545761 RepID=A0A4V2WMJ4_9BACT|nr:DUF3303 family protein [Flaviaesturariibacter aridisoli]TCZ69889.1 hypothetical protein E0486_11675 [Flaviaesturariibacter aridisoli]